MNNTIFQKLPFLGECNPSEVSQLELSCSEISLNEGDIITRQFSDGKFFYLLYDGSVKFSIKLDEETDELVVGETQGPWIPIGWSGFRSPRRYATTVKCASSCTLLKWSHLELEELFEKHPSLGLEFVLFVLDHSYGLLESARNLLYQYNKTNWEFKSDLKTVYNAKNPAPPDLLGIMQRSPFFDIFPEAILKRLSILGEAVEYPRGSIIFRRGEEGYGFSLLARGKLGFDFSPSPEEQTITLRSFSTPGWIASWTGVAPSISNDITLVAQQDSVIYHFDRDALSTYIKSNPDFGFEFTKRILWLIGNHLRTARAQLISQQFEREILAIKNLIEQNCTQLSVKSPLHKVPHLLSSTLTLDDAFDCLHKVLHEGGTTEKSIASLCLDILGHVHQEYEFFDGLREIYHFVANAEPELDPKTIRNMCSAKFIHIFENTPHVIKGWENLPDEPGNIFIYNHLLNHPYNTLPNNFQITLDSHFLSSMILYKKYQDAGVRVVRVPRGEEYGHHYYYTRMGHIEVVTKESDTVDSTKEEREARRELFYKEAGDYLKQGTNILLSPEGTSFITEESPGPFKAGAFRLAAHVNPEPYIVPIAVANFDKRLNHSTFAVVIKEPFKVNKVVSDAEGDKNALFDFLTEYQKTYKTFVQEATALAKEYNLNQLRIQEFTSVNRQDR